MSRGDKSVLWWVSWAASLKLQEIVANILFLSSHIQLEFFTFLDIFQRILMYFNYFLRTKNSTITLMAARGLAYMLLSHLLKTHKLFSLMDSDCVKPFIAKWHCVLTNEHWVKENPIGVCKLLNTTMSNMLNPDYKLYLFDDSTQQIGVTLLRYTTLYGLWETLIGFELSELQNQAKTHLVCPQRYCELLTEGSSRQNKK